MEVELPNKGQYEEPTDDTFGLDTAEKLKQCVAEAFADVVYPGDGNRDIIASGCRCAECGETHELFQGKHWLEVAESEEGLQNIGWGGLVLLTPAAWKFYLPAYLLVSLSGSDGAENALECALFALTPWPPKGLAELGGGVIDYVKSSADWFSKRAFNFSVAQMECLAAYMCAVRGFDPDDEVKEHTDLATYWTDRAAEARAEQCTALYNDDASQ